VRLNPKTALYADLGFKGIDKLHEKSVLPLKSSKKHPLTKEQKEHNREQASIRMPVEHVNRQCKVFRIVKDTYRGKHRNYGLNWNLVAAINNLKMACRHLSQDTP
jgi:IS5 family transposase